MHSLPHSFERVLGVGRALLCAAVVAGLPGCSSDAPTEGVPAPDSTPPLIDTGEQDSEVEDTGNADVGLDAEPTEDVPEPDAADAADAPTPDIEPDVAQPHRCEVDPVNAGPSHLRRLNHLELGLTLQDLFALTEPPDLSLLPVEVTDHGFEGVVQRQTFSASHLTGYLGLAEKLSEQLLADPERRDRVVTCDVEDPRCLETFILAFGRRAWRRPVETHELSAIHAAASALSVNADERFGFVIQVLLTSPHFLYRVELGTSDGLTSLTPHELASRLAFALWGTGPSQDLLDDADEWDLSDPNLLSSVAARMTRDDRWHALYMGFFEQWLGLNRPVAPGDPPPGWTENIVEAMADETRALVSEFAFGSGGDVFDILTANHTFISHADLGALYEPEAPIPVGHFEYPADHPRAHSGVVAQPALIAAKRDGELIPIRGNWLRSTFLCSDLTLPPGLVEDVADEIESLTEEELIRHRMADPDCGGCHQLLDPIGIGYSIFDQFGLYDPESHPERFDVATELVGAVDPGFTTMGELAATLRTMPELTECFVDRLYLFVSGRRPTYDDECHIRQMTEAFIAGDHNLRDLVIAMVSAPEFRVRRTHPDPE